MLILTSYDFSVMSIPEEKINSAKERVVEQPKARTIEI
jgi:hypothetical protein